jgi:flagellar assembly protein FliH
MGAATKFTFDVEFRDEGDLVSNAARGRQKRSLTQEEIDQLCAKARAEGIKSGQVRALESVAAGTGDVIAALNAALAEAQRQLDFVRAECAELALSAARKLARAALAAVPAGEVEAALREAMHQAIGEPRIVLRAEAAVAEAISGRLAEIALEEGYDGRVQISSDPALKGADCRIEWRGGGAERAEAAIEAVLGELIARRFANSALPIAKKEQTHVGQ